MKLKVTIIFTLMVYGSISTNNFFDKERNKVNNNKNWITHVKETTDKSGKFEYKTNNQNITVNWQISDITSKNLAKFKSEVSDLAAKTTAKSEIEFSKVFPQAVTQEMFLKPSAKFFEHGIENVDWDLAQKEIEKTVKQFYLTDISAFGPQVIQMLQNDVYIFAQAKDNNDNLIGFIMLAITPALKYGEVKMINLIIEDNQWNLEIEKTLLASVFKIIPDAQLIFTAQRITSKNSKSKLNSLGFDVDNEIATDPNHKLNLEYFTMLSYRADKNDILQEFSKLLI